MKFYQKVLLSLLFAIALELCWFQRSIWRIRRDRDAPRNDQYELADMVLLNWRETDGEYISEADPIIYIPTDPMYLNELEIHFVTEPVCENCLFYYTAESGEVRAESFIADRGSARIMIGQNVGPILRVDLGEDAGTKLKSVSAVINPAQMHISISRMIAVVLIYVCGSLLFRIQRMPDYTKYIQNQEETCDMPLLITGASGYVGSRLYESLPQSVRQDCLCPSHRELDLNNPRSVEAYFAAHQITSVLHLAACLDNENDAGLFQANIAGVYNLLRECRESCVKYLCFVSSNNVYDTAGCEDCSEDDAPRPTSENRYGISKLFGEFAVRALLDGTDTAYSIVRIGDIYGPGQKTGALLKAVVNNIKSGLPQKLYGTGDRVRDYIYIDDVAEGLSFVLAQKLRGTYNLATGVGTSVAEIIACAEKLSPCKEPTQLVAVEHEDHSRVVLNVDKLTAAGYKAKISFAEGLRRIIEEEMKSE